MRNEPIPAPKGNVLCAGSRWSWAGCDRPRQGAKGPDLPKRDWPGGSLALHQPAHLQEQTMPRPYRGSSGSVVDPKEECFTGRFS